MDVLTSSEFRKVYAKLTEATIVEVNGHYIGTWMPAAKGARVVAEGAHIRATAALPDAYQRPFAGFRPVPKPGRK